MGLGSIGLRGTFKGDFGGYVGFRDEGLGFPRLRGTILGCLKIRNRIS